jgi:hypothetical protein
LRSRCEAGGHRLGRDEQNDIIIDKDVVLFSAQTKPGGDLDRLLVMPPMEEAYPPKVIERSRDIDPHGFAFLMRFVDLGMGDFRKVRILEDGFE